MNICSDVGYVVCKNCGVTNEIVFGDTYVDNIPDGYQAAIVECWGCKHSFIENRLKRIYEWDYIKKLLC